MEPNFFPRSLPAGLEGLADLSLDLRWSWSHHTDRLWERLDPEIWERTRNPYYVLQSVSTARLEEVAASAEFRGDLVGWLEERRNYLAEEGWFRREHSGRELARVAYFSMEFGLSEALPIYSGGLGVLAGDHLKTASDLGVPLVAIGLLYQQGYFRQTLATDGSQVESFPYNDPTTLPIVPVLDRDGARLRIRLELPGRALVVRVWKASAGRTTLYLLDSNDPLNGPSDRAITATLYPSAPERRFLQEIILGIGGARVLRALGIDADVWHINEGHAAFAILARALGYMRDTRMSFPAALWATRVGNVFTTHTSVEAAFDRYDPALIAPYAATLAELVGVGVAELLALGRRDAADQHEPFNMAFLAARGSRWINAVSRRHGETSRELFASIYPRRPRIEVPITHITNGVHVPSWDSVDADRLWTIYCGKSRWTGTLDGLAPSIECVSDADLWTFRSRERQELIRYVRRRYVRQLEQHGAPAEIRERAASVLDPDALTIGFARRFATYKRPTLLLRDASRLVRLITSPERPVQIIVAGKAHPQDHHGRELVREMALFAARPDVFGRFIFLEDHDVTLAQELVGGIDVWINTPRSPWEACGTSGMKVLVNGGLNLSTLDGWWEEAWSEDVGWAIEVPNSRDEATPDSSAAARLLEILETIVIPEFYRRDPERLPRDWLRRIRASMQALAPRFSSNRMLRDYVTKAYLPAAEAFRNRSRDGGRLASALEAWQLEIRSKWESLRFGALEATRDGENWDVRVEVVCGEFDPSLLRVELWADPRGDDPAPFCKTLARSELLQGAESGWIYAGKAPSSRPIEHYTPRLIPFHPEAVIPLEEPSILWRS
jgi:starch phosphorylase